MVEQLNGEGRAGYIKAGYDKRQLIAPALNVAALVLQSPRYIDWT